MRLVERFGPHRVTRDMDGMVSFLHFYSMKVDFAYSTDHCAGLLRTMRCQYVDGLGSQIRIRHCLSMTNRCFDSGHQGNWRVAVLSAVSSVRSRDLCCAIRVI
jgi:hypothetical protein